MARPERAVPDARWVNVVKPGGEVVAIPSYDVERVLGQGWKVETDAMRRERLVQAKYGDRDLEAALMGAARGATFGLSDQLLTKTGLVEPTTAAGLSEASPIASIGGEIGGVVGSALLSKKAPAAQLSKLGQGIRGATAAKLGGGIVGKGVGAAAGFGAEGAVYGAGQLISEEALGKAEFTAENLAAYAGMGAATGAGMGAAFGFGGELAKRAAIGVTKATAKGVDRLYQAATGQDAGKVGDAYRKMSRTLAKSGALFTDATEDDVYRAMTSKTFRDAAKSGQAELSAATDEVGYALDDMVRAGDALDPLTMGLMKRDRIAKTVMTGNEGAVVNETREMLNRISKRLYAFTNSGPSEQRNAAKQALKLVREAEAEAGGLQFLKATKKRPARYEPVQGFQGDNTSAFFHIDRLKRFLGQKKFSGAGMQHPGGIKGDLRSAIREIYDGELRPFLMRDDLWGADIAGIQKQLNQIYQRYLHNVGEFKKTFMSPTRVDEKMVGEGRWSLLFDHDKGKIEQLLKKIGTGTGKAREMTDLFDQHLRARADLTRLIKENFEVPPEFASWASKSDESLTKISQALGGAESRLAAKNKIELMRGPTDIAAPAIGYAIGGAPGAAAAHLLTRPDKIITGLSYLDDLMAKTQGRMLKSVEAFIEKSSVEAGKAFSLTGPARGLLAGKVGASQGTLDERYDKAMIDALSAVKDPEMTARRLADDVAALAEVAPTVSQHLVIKGIASAQYKAEQVPGSPLEPSAFDDPESPRQPSRFQKAEFLQKVEVADNPSAALAHLADGSLTTAHVHALEATSPELYEWIRQQLMQRVGPKMRYQARLKMAKLFRAPLDPSLNPAFINGMRPKAPQRPSHQAKGTPGGPSGAPGSNQGITVDQRRMSGASALALA